MSLSVISRLRARHRPENETRKKVSHRTTSQASHCASSGSTEPVAARSLQGGWSDKHSTPVSAWGSQVSGKERGGLRILSGILSSVCGEYGLQQITSLTSTEKARRRMFADTISNSWRGILLHSPPPWFSRIRLYSPLSLFCFCLSPRNSFYVSNHIKSTHLLRVYLCLVCWMFIYKPLMYLKFTWLLLVYSVCWHVSDGALHIFGTFR